VARVAVIGAALAAALVAAPAGTTAGGFSARVDNPWFPLRPGTTYVYRGVKDGKPSRDVVTVSAKTKTIHGVPCAVVQDRLYVNGRLHERTTDWYSQDARGNVWYFGEATAELDANGRVTTTEGSWQAGRGGAVAGIFMPARPKVGQTGRQEYYKGHAEDHFRVLAVQARVATAYMRSTKALLVKEWTPLEPGTLDHKYYVRGTGLVLERTVKGGDERNELVSVQKHA
jgi:hypothetical protein